MGRIAVGTALTGLLLVTTACGIETGPAASETVPITPRAIAAIAIDHVGADTSERGATYTDEDSPPGWLGADLRYRPSPGDDGDLVRVVVAPGEPAQDPCVHAECAELDTDVAGARLVLRWEELVPEEDPGVVMVVMLRDDEYSFALQAGPAITDDPRQLDLPESVEDMVAVVEDPRLRLETTADAVTAGGDLADWEGEDPEPSGPPATGRADLTDRAVAVVVDERLPGAVAARPPESDWGEVVGSELEYEGAPGVRVTVAAVGTGDPCRPARCRERRTDVPGAALLAGRDESGRVLVLRLPEQVVVLRQVGDVFTEAQLAAVVEDPRLRLRTRAALVQEGEALAIWEG
ncbi:hypothetical protein GCM10009623_06240 [Nocardioides aestuarii]|uniref:Lipoprotein n=1 Tax=Nocardioides aestuarii TaxID=252231 RepID=A0ABW4TGG9_9ACTN